MRTTPTPRRLAAGALAVVAALPLAGCGDDHADTTKTSAPSHDTSAQRDAARWLTGQLTKGLMHDDKYGFDDYGLSADTALTLASLDGDAYSGTVRTIAERVAAHIKDYVSPGYGTLTSAGGTAKALLAETAAGTDPTKVDGVDLVAQLERVTADSEPIAGRIQDELDPHEKKAADYANTVAQSYAVSALSAVKSSESPAATGFLIDQQCAEGWFRVMFTADPTAADQTCDGDKTSRPDVDATAFAVLALESVPGEEAATAARKAVAWLKTQQASDGSFAAGQPAVANANSTGLAGQALGEEGDPKAAEQAARWVAAHQLGRGVCATADQGAIAYDDASAKAGVTKDTAGQFRLATVQALPVLRWLPAGTKKAAC